MRSPALRLLALLALVLATNAQQRREQAVQQQEPGAALAAAAADAPGAAAAPQQPHDPQRALGSIGWEEAAKPRGGVPGSLRLGTTAPAPAQPHSPEALAAAALFLHPLTPPNKRHDRDVAEQAHADMQQWLKGFFAEASSASRLTSTRLQAARVALPPPPPPAAVPPPANATDTPANITAAATNSTASPPPKPEPPRTDVLEAAGEQPCNATCARAAAERLLLRGEQPGQRALQLRWPQFPEDPRRWAARPHANGTCLPRQPREALSRDYLLVAAVGNNLSAVDRQVPIGWLARWRASWWLDQPDSATFDVVLLHYGNATELRCPRCAAVLRAAGPKWQLMWALTQHPAWRQLSAGRKAVMVADDDVLFTTCEANRVFEVFSAYGLMLGQPSLCATRHRPSWWAHLVQDRGATLRFVTMVEIMAPIFEMSFFEGLVRPSLWDAYTGWGLDFVWPFLLHYPRDRIAVIDEVCMLHPHQAEDKKGEGSIYAALSRVAPYDAREEEARRDAQYNYWPSEVRALGFPYRSDAVVGRVPDPAYVPPPPPSPSPSPPPAAPAPSTSARLFDRPWVAYAQISGLLAAAGAMMWATAPRRLLGSPARAAPGRAAPKWQLSPKHALPR